MHALRIKMCSDTMSCQLQKWPDMSGHANFHIKSHSVQCRINTIEMLSRREKSPTLAAAATHAFSCQTTSLMTMRQRIDVPFLFVICKKVRGHFVRMCTKHPETDRKRSEIVLCPTVISRPARVCV